MCVCVLCVYRGIKAIWQTIKMLNDSLWVLRLYTNSIFFSFAFPNFTNKHELLVQLKYFLKKKVSIYIPGEVEKNIYGF